MGLALERPAIAPGFGELDRLRYDQLSYAVLASERG